MDVGQICLQISLLFMCGRKKPVKRPLYESVHVYMCACWACLFRVCVCVCVCAY